MLSQDGCAESADPLIGERLGHFDILELVGRGGMGSVYKARQAALDRLVALKVLAPELSTDERWTARFEREARAAAAIEHPHIIEIISVGTDRGYHYIAMELVEGENLATVLEREGRLPLTRAADLMKQVASALAAAHEAGVIHRDIKPANILLDPMGNAKVADFGIARRAEANPGLSTTDAAPGTPLYMAPEASRGAAPDARSDLYSLGATFYHALAGFPPFRGRSAAELLVQHATEKPAPLDEVVPHVPPALALLLARLLEKDPDARFPSAQALLGELEALSPFPEPPTVHLAEAAAAGDATQILGRDAATLAQPPGRLARHARPRARLAAVGLACLAVLAAALLTSRSRRRVPPAPLTEAPQEAPAPAPKDKAPTPPPHGKAPPPERDSVRA